MSTLSHPPQFGDVIEPTIEQDAQAYLERALTLIRRECGIAMADMAREVLGVLAENDGMNRKDLWEAVYESLEIRLLPRGPIACAIDELATRSVLIEADGRYSLNPAVAALIGREAA